MNTIDFTGGYDVKIFALKPSENFSCPLCFNIINDGKQCPNGHSFCDQCIRRAVSKRPECPMCNIQLTEDRFSRSLFIQNRIQELTTVCMSITDQPADGLEVCGWSGLLCQREAHFSNECDFRLVECSNSLCSESIPRKYLSSHVTNNCKHRQVKCEFCDTSMQFAVLQQHTEQCDQRPVSCTNNCGANVLSSRMTTHLQTDCRFVPLTVPFTSQTAVLNVQEQWLTRNSAPMFPPLLGSLTLF